MHASRRFGSVKALVAASTLAVVAVLAVAPAFGCGATGGSAQVRPARAEAGATVDVSGTLFRPEMGEVAIKWGTASGVLLATAAVDAAGSFGPVPIVIPANAEPARFYQISVYQPADPAARVSNFAFEVAGTPAPVVTQPQPTPSPAPAPATQPAATASPAPAVQAAPAQSSQPAAAPAASTATAARTPRPAAATATAPVAAAAPAPTPAAEPVPVPEVAATPPAAGLELPEVVETNPADAAPVQPLVVSDPAAMGGPRTIDGGPSLWVLVPLVVVGLTLFAASGAIVVHEVRRRRQAVKA